MILCVDIGNTNITCAIGSSESFIHASVFSSRVEDRNDFLHFLDERFEEHMIKQLCGCIISSVIPEKTKIIIEAVKALGSAPPNVPQISDSSHEQAEGKIHVRLIDKDALGVDFSGYNGRLGDDRVVCCEALATKYQAPIILIDFGTATTINVVDEDNCFLGGAILPGVLTGLDALSSRTAQLPLVSDFSNVRLIGSDTAQCLVSGAIIGTACMIDGYVDRIDSILTDEPTIVITGGNSAKIAPHLSFSFIYEPSLILEGLFLIYEQ